ncbi:MAG: peptide chain release factor N(5)-glutamine methyltransferase [Actinomycetota bacterium]|nr:peptide chain release factor N(5)-glutamine methyltransferase [Actinomycetota bacterium]
MTALRDGIAAATRQLGEAGVDSPRHDAEALAAHVLGVGRGELTLVADFGPLAPAYAELVDRRASREPLQHLVGSVGFRHLELAVGPGVFVPRPETESVVQWALDAAAAEGWPAPLVVDLCTGSGTMALAIAQELPGASVHGVERDPVALRWTRRNAEARAAAGDAPVTLHLGDVTDALPELDGTVDLVVSNPPYVAVGERAQVDPEVRDHDPEIALWAGEDGLDVIRLVAATARRLLRPGGLLVVEHSDRQGTSVPALLRADGCWAEVADHRDYADRDRFATARRTAAP